MKVGQKVDRGAVEIQAVRGAFFVVDVKAFHRFSFLYGVGSGRRDAWTRGEIMFSG